MTYLTAEWILPISSPPIHRGFIKIENGTIIDIGPHSGEVEPIILLPGFINTHCHLEHSAAGLLKKLKPTPSFTDWVRQLMTLGAEISEEQFQNGIQQATTQLLESGVTTIADHQSPWSSRIHTPLRRIIFWEVLGSSIEAGLASYEKAKERKKEEGGFITPHSLYALYPTVFKQILLEKAPLSIHFLESIEEKDHFEHSLNPLTDLVREKGGEVPFRQNLFKFLKHRRNKTIFVHFNEDEDSKNWKALPKNRSFVHCPGSHHFFNHHMPDLQNWEAQKENISLGTDSLASNSSLSFLDELRQLQKRNPDYFTAERLLKMATLNGAHTLDLESYLGSLDRNKRADIIAFPVAPSSESPYEQILKAEKSLWAMIDGKQIDFISSSS